MNKWSCLGYVQCSTFGEGIKVPFDLGNNVILTEVPGWGRGSEVTKSRDRKVRDGIAGSKYVLRSDYEAGSICSVQDKITGGINLARLAVWLVKPTSFNIFFCAHFEEHSDSPLIWRQSVTIETFELHDQSLGNRLTPDDLSLANRLNTSISSIKTNTTIWIAVQFLYKALMEDMWQVKYALMWFAMEALFGCDQEITYRLSLRASMFLSDSKEVAKENFDKIKRGYGIRCTIVHGSKIKGLKPEESPDLSYDLQEFLRKALNIILLNKDHITTFNSSGRRTSYLDNLVFEAQ